MKVLFVWGAGGVGKTHVAIRRAYENAGSMLVTLDPSRRALELFSADPKAVDIKAKLGERELHLKSLASSMLFEELSRKSIPNPTVKIFFDKMVSGLQQFRDYLLLIQLADELASANADSIIVDTPPFQEAHQLQRSLFHLKAFFSNAAVKLALKGSRLNLVQKATRKVFELTSRFVGKKSSEQAFEFLEWIVSHEERFQKSATLLAKLLSSESTKHCVVLSPETRPDFLKEVNQELGAYKSQLEFVLNRCPGIELDRLKDSEPELELKEQILLEDLWRRRLKVQYRESPVERLPLQLMGDDSVEELLRFCREKPLS